MYNELKLKAVSCYSVYIDTSEREGHIKGYYSNYGEAEKAAKGAGWYGSNGRIDQVEHYQDGDGVLYQVMEIGMYRDVLEAEEASLNKAIREKLTERELKFLKEKGFKDK